MIPKLIIINWEDAITPTDGWTNINDLKSELADCISLGIVVEENEKTLTIISHISGDEKDVDIDGSLVLDKNWIKFRKDLPMPKELTDRIKSWLLKRKTDVKKS